MKTFGQYIQEKRIEKGITRAEMARRVGITPQYALDIERDKTLPSEDVIEKLVGVLEADEREAFRLADRLPPRILEKVKRLYYQGEEI